MMIRCEVLGGTASAYTPEEATQATQSAHPPTSCVLLPQRLELPQTVTFADLNSKLLQLLHKCLIIWVFRAHLDLIKAIRDINGRLLLFLLLALLTLAAANARSALAVRLQLITAITWGLIALGARCMLAWRRVKRKSFCRHEELVFKLHGLGVVKMFLRQEVIAAELVNFLGRSCCFDTLEQGKIRLIHLLRNIWLLLFRFRIEVTIAAKAGWLDLVHVARITHE